MLTDDLKSAISELEKLILVTSEDIEQIREANHDRVFKNAKVKNELISNFESKKSKIDKELIELVTRNDKPLDEILEEDEQKLIDSMKLKLEELKELNRRYAKLVLGVSEFYNSLLERVVPTEMDGYERVKSSNSFLHLKA